MADSLEALDARLGNDIYDKYLVSRHLYDRGMITACIETIEFYLKDSQLPEMMQLTTLHLLALCHIDRHGLSDVLLRANTIWLSMRKDSALGNSEALDTILADVRRCHDSLGELLPPDSQERTSGRSDHRGGNEGTDTKEQDNMEHDRVESTKHGAETLPNHGQTKSASAASKLKPGPIVTIEELVEAFVCSCKVSVIDINDEDYDGTVANKDVFLNMLGEIHQTKANKPTHTTLESASATSHTKPAPNHETKGLAESFRAMTDIMLQATKQQEDKVQPMSPPEKTQNSSQPQKHRLKSVERLCLKLAQIQREQVQILHERGQFFADQKQLERQQKQFIDEQKQRSEEVQELVGGEHLAVMQNLQRIGEMWKTVRAKGAELQKQCLDQVEQGKELSKRALRKKVESNDIMINLGQIEVEESEMQLLKLKENLRARLQRRTELEQELRMLQ